MSPEHSALCDALVKCGIGGQIGSDPNGGPNPVFIFTPEQAGKLGKLLDGMSTAPKQHASVDDKLMQRARSIGTMSLT